MRLFARLRPHRHESATAHQSIAYCLVVSLWVPYLRKGSEGRMMRMGSARSMRRHLTVTMVLLITLSMATGLAACSRADSERAPGPLLIAPSRLAAIPGDASVVLSWSRSRSSGETSISEYRAEVSPSSKSCSTTGTACAIDGLINGQVYNVSVHARSTGGKETVSAAIHVIPGVPGEPTDVTGSPGDTSASVGWNSPPDNGGSIVSYLATATPGGHSCRSSGVTNCTVLGLINGTAYEFSVVATNSRGIGSPSLASAPAIPRLTAGGSAGITYLGPVFSRDESPTSILQRDAGMSVPLPNGRDLWIFGDTGEFANGGTWTSSGSIGGSTAAKSHDTRGGSPAPLKEVGPHRGLTPQGVPTQFIPSPTGVYVPDGSRRLCTLANGALEAARWPTGAVLMPDGTDILVSYADVCVMSSADYSVEGWGFMEYRWKVNRIHVGPIDVFPPAASGSPISPALTFGSPIAINGNVTFLSSACTQVFVLCSSGNIYSTTVTASTAVLQSPSSYAPHPLQANSSTGWRPVGVSVAAYADAGVRLVEQTSIGGTFVVFSAPTVDGPWTTEVSGTLPGCSTSPRGFCYSFIGHPEFSSASELVVSYFKPDAGPDPAAGHLVLASIALPAGR